MSAGMNELHSCPVWVFLGFQNRPKQIHPSSPDTRYTFLVVVIKSLYQIILLLLWS